MAATYGAGKMSPVGRRRPRSRPRCRSCRSAPPAGPPGSAGRAVGAPTMPRAAARHIHRPPLTAGPPHGPARSIAVTHDRRRVSPRCTHSPLTDPLTIPHGWVPGAAIMEVPRGSPASPPARTARRRQLARPGC
ncbi:uncharacterized protein LOC131584236 [Poecile atricapillus]|uniref:uncharacterized protein LOC131584236 n=1 Tax=Poecile atricapillus TaxID=48891 RepID=UPI00273904B4|nr:uncharacterized protein LOC131584236 [Poecile atricapillus]